MIDHQKYLSLMTALSVLPGCRDLDVALEAYWIALGDLADEEFEMAARAALRRSKFFPVPSELLAIARPTDDPAFLAGQALRACLMVQGKHPRSRDWYAGKHILDEVGDAAYQAFHAIGGAPGLEDLDHDFHGPGIRKRFLECFERVVRIEPQLALPAPSQPDATPEEMKHLTAGIVRSFAFPRERRPA